MLIQRLKDKFYDSFISTKIPQTGRIFNIVLSLGVVGSLAGWIITLGTATSILSILSTALLPAIILITLFIVNKTRNYRMGGLLVSIMFCDIGFPFVFFSSGGIHSGMLAYLLLGAIVISVLLKGKDFAIMLPVYLVINVASFFAQMTGIVKVKPIETEFMLYLDIAVSFTIACLTMVFVLKYQNYVYEGARKAAEEASKTKSNFLSNMSHEMRTPMNAIIGMTAIGKSATAIEQKDYAFEKIETASTHLLGVINDILDMSKIEAGKLELSFSDFDFENMLQRVVNVISFRVDEKRQILAVYIDKKIPRMLSGDDQRLAQIITNLLSNAVKFTPENGEIRLEARLLEEKNNALTLQIEVADTGIGISEDQQARLFTSFQQAESSTSRKFGGTGLGLAISKRIVEMMDGQIWIKSELGHGSTFGFTLRTKRSASSGSGVLLPGVDRAKVRALAVDDAPEVRAYLTDIVQGLGVLCDSASDGEEAWALIDSKEPYDIYFIDWKMPGMDGIELSRRIKSRGGNESIIIMISSVEWNIIEKDAIDAGVSRFLTKPLFPSVIEDCVNECLGAAPVQAAAGEREKDDFNGRRILLAEDVEINREIMLSLLEPSGLAIDCAENGAEAFNLFSKNYGSYDLVFMDVQMPEMDGYEATRRIRAFEAERFKDQQRDYERIPIVAMTANVFKEDIEKCLAAGMDGHLGKPLDMNDVLGSLRKYLKQKVGAT
jgi:signal transduction histidine kinase/DNA-binding response OmpR family regulator